MDALLRRLRASQAGGVKLHVSHYQKDCGDAADEIERLRAENKRLVEACARCGLEGERMHTLLKGIGEFCSGDNRTLGAIERLAHIQNTVVRELARHEQSHGEAK